MSFEKKEFSYKNVIFVLFFLFYTILIFFIGLFLGHSRDKTSFSTKAKQPTISVIKRPICLFNQAALVKNITYPPNQNLILIKRNSGFLLNQDFTIEFLVKQLSRENFVNPSIFSIGNRLNLFFESGSSGKQNKIALITGDGNIIKSLVGPELALNSWHHIAVSFRKTGNNVGTVGLHVDGNTIKSTQMPFADELFVIEMGESYFHGLIDEVRILNTIAYSQEKPTYQIPQKPFNNNRNTYLLLHLDGNPNDASSYGNHAQIQGDVPFVNSDYRCTSITTPTSMPSPSSSNPPNKRAFITSIGFTGNLGGLEGADIKCQERADSVNLGGRWKAWLSDNMTSVSSRFNHSFVPYVRIDGVVIANNWDDLIDGILLNPISIAENGTYIGNYVWSGTKHTGEIINPGESKCLNWTSAEDFSGSGAVGHSGYTDYQWSWGSSYACNKIFHLYCFEQ